MFETEVFRKQIYCIEESTCDIVCTFRFPRSDIEFCIRSPVMQVVAHSKLFISSGPLMPWLETSCMFLFNNAVLHLIFYSLSSNACCFLQASIFLPLRNASLWRWANVVAAGALFQCLFFRIACVYTSGSQPFQCRGPLWKLWTP